MMMGGGGGAAAGTAVGIGAGGASASPMALKTLIHATDPLRSGANAMGKGMDKINPYFRELLMQSHWNDQ
jgi:hypothetical protein